MIIGKHLIHGEWVGGKDSFQNEPVSGASEAFSNGTEAEVDLAAKAAEDAFASFSATSRAKRAEFLRRIAQEIEGRIEDIVAQGSRETGLPDARLRGECGRTTGQLRLFADHIDAGDYLDRRHDAPLPDRSPLPRPDLRLMQRPIGPVAVFGASNFPLAFSTAGGDTAAALAAGCPVVVKGHPAHPGVSDLIAQAILAAIDSCEIHPGTFNQIQGAGYQIGQALVQHPLVLAVAFTGSHAGGRALFDLCAARPVPIPFFGELGSVNPIFLLDNAISQRGGAIAQGWAASLTLGAGQFCTNPGVAILTRGDACDAFIDGARTALSTVEPQTMLTHSIAEAFLKGCERVSSTENVEEVVSTPCPERGAGPQLFQTTGSAWLSNEDLAEEVFGPLGIVIVVENAAEMPAVAASFVGQLTCTIHMEDSDIDVARALVPILERKAGRLLVNGYPTGVEVAEAMVHGGPYPASTNFGATSVGTMAIRRFLRPVCYQNLPEALLPNDLL